MNELSPSQVVIDHIWSESQRLGFRTTDYIDKVLDELPCVYIGQTFQQDRVTNKDLIFPSVQQAVHIYGSKGAKLQVTKMGHELLKALRKTVRLDGYVIVPEDHTMELVLALSETSAPIWDAYLFCKFKFA